MDRPTIGLALGGGAAKGWAHIGFMQALDEAGIRPDVIAGTSIGAVVGGCWAAGHLDELERFARSLTQRRVFNLMDVSLSGSGLINGKKLGELLTRNLEGADIEDLPLPFCCMATELSNGNEIWLSNGSLSNALQASYALPGIFKPVKVANRWLVDGALVNPVPITACRSLGADYVIAVSLSTSGVGRGTVISTQSVQTPQQENPTVDAPETEPPMTAGALSNPMALLKQQIMGEKNGPPGIYSVMMQSYNIIQDRIARSRLAGDPPELLITPDIADIGLFDFHRADEAIAMGRAAAAPVITTLAPGELQRATA